MERCIYNSEKNKQTNKRTAKAHKSHRHPKFISNAVAVHGIQIKDKLLNFYVTDQEHNY